LLDSGFLSLLGGLLDLILVEASEDLVEFVSVVLASGLNLSLTEKLHESVQSDQVEVVEELLKVLGGHGVGNKHDLLGSALEETTPRALGLSEDENIGGNLKGVSC